MRQSATARAGGSTHSPDQNRSLRAGGRWRTARHLRAGWAMGTPRTRPPARDIWIGPAEGSRRRSTAGSPTRGWTAAARRATGVRRAHEAGRHPSTSGECNAAPVVGRPLHRHRPTVAMRPGSRRATERPRRCQTSSRRPTRRAADRAPAAWPANRVAPSGALCRSSDKSLNECWSTSCPATKQADAPPHRALPIRLRPRWARPLLRPPASGPIDTTTAGCMDQTLPGSYPHMVASPFLHVNDERRRYFRCRVGEWASGVIFKYYLQKCARVSRGVCVLRDGVGVLPRAWGLGDSGFVVVDNLWGQAALRERRDALRAGS
eukprot:scaffold1302_cov114-Isochrysis_galbana.AAC.5